MRVLKVALKHCQFFASSPLEEGGRQIDENIPVRLREIDSHIFPFSEGELSYSFPIGEGGLRGIDKNIPHTFGISKHRGID